MFIKAAKDINKKASLKLVVYSFCVLEVKQMRKYLAIGGVTKDEQYYSLPSLLEGWD